ncbi:hypothetical protein SPRG_07375 [Saprolegnia parasitica CBS 223.65]|uniref:RING-type domain-containing protein n=1 Tax=Saprolegnia parasitica (strain CBS 223.65) TaxID=695850 RepID=A0A067CMM3_SAPPC|nr:hypothetical protein SPRG_07375 [Saprolegnia parasitica CBS 223.65]KDO27776.1 hypothetical protein SPRG_07375 [Saprolegnia parasitica CBS 223.65]|eukprot:XP_012201551.1 hypothetical protein SPRG_07375 [Saprolegnia parasitica CBS 223.65]
MHRLFRKDRTSPSRQEPPPSRTSESAVSPARSSASDSDASKKLAIRDLDAEPSAAASAVTALLALVESQDHFPLTRSEAADVVKRCSARVSSALRNTIESAEKAKGKPSIFTSASPPRALWCLPATSVSLALQAMQLLSLAIRDEANALLVLDEKLGRRLVACLDIALHASKSSDAEARTRAIESMAHLLSVLVTYAPIVADLAEKDQLVSLYHMCSTTLENAKVLHTVLLQLPKAIAGPHAKSIVAHLCSRDVLLILLEQMAVVDACDASGILHVVAAHLQHAARQNLSALHAQLLSRQRYEALLPFLVTWLTAQATTGLTEQTFDLIHSLQELLASGNETPGEHYTAKVKETLTIFQPTRRSVCTCNAAVLDVVTKLIYRLQQPLGASLTSYEELVQCQLVHTVGHVLAQDASHYLVASEAGLLEGFLQRLEEFSDVVKLAIGSVISSVAIEAGVVPMLELRRMQRLLDMRTFSYASVHMLLVLLANLVRFDTEYLDVLRTVRLTQTLYNMFVEGAQSTFRYAWPTGDGLATECTAAALDAILVSHTELLATEDDDDEASSDVGASIVAHDHNVPLMFELLSASMVQNEGFWTRDLLDAMSTWIFVPAHRHPCVFLWATLLRATAQTQPTAVFTTDVLNWGLQAMRKTLVSPTPDWHLVVLLLTYMATLQSPPSTGLRPWDFAHVTEHMVAPLPTPNALASILLACDADVVLATVLLVLSRSPPTDPPLTLHVVDALFCLVQTSSLQSDVFRDGVHRRIPWSFHGRLLVSLVASTAAPDQAALAQTVCWYVAALAVDVAPATLQSPGGHKNLRLVHPEAIVGLLQLLQTWSAYLRDDVIDQLVDYLHAVTASSDHIARLVDAGALEAMLRAYFPMPRDAFRPMGDLLVHMAQVRLGPRDLRTWVECILSDACPSLLPRLLASYPCDDDVLSTATNLPRFELHLDGNGYAQYTVEVLPGAAWPPQDGYTISSWVYISEACEAHSDVEKLYHQLTQRDTCIMCMAVYASPVPLKCSHVACRACVQRLADFGGACVVCNAPSLYLWSLRSADGRSVVDVFLKGTKLFMKTNAAKHPTPFQHPPLLEKRWYHIALVHAHQRFQFQSGSAVSLYIQGSVQETTKLSFPVASPSAFSGFFGVPSATRRPSKGKWCLGPTYVIEEPLAPGTIAALYATGPQYDQLFSAPMATGRCPSRSMVAPSPPHPRSLTWWPRPWVSLCCIDPVLAPAALPTHSVLIGADKILFAYSPRNAIGASTLCNTSRQGLPHAHASGGATAVDPTLLPEAAFQLCGAGAKLAYVLLEHARTIESVDASLQLLLALTRGHRVHLAGVERESGYEIVNFLLRQKSHLLSQRALSTLFRVVQGDVFNCAALQHWILDVSIWLPTAANVQRALCATLYQLLLVATSVDKKKLQSINIVRQLLDVFLLGNLCLELASVFADLVLVCLDTLATDANYVDVSLFLASLMSSNFRFVTHDAAVASVPKQLDRWGLSPRGRSRHAIAAVPDRALHRQAHLRELLLSIVIKAVQKQDVKLTKLQAADASPRSSSTNAPTMLPRPKIQGARKLLTPAWLGLFLYPSQLPQLPLVAASPNTVLLGLQLLGVLLTNQAYEVSFKHKGLYKVLASALPASDHAGFPFEAMYFSLLCLVLGPPVDGWPHNKVDRIVLNVAHLTHDFAPNIASNVVKNHSMVTVLLAVVRRGYGSVPSIEPDILHLEVLRFVRYLYETMPAFADVIDTSLHRDLATLIAAVVMSSSAHSFAHPVAAAALDLLVESLTMLCVTTLTGLNVAKSVVAGSNTGSLSDATFAEFQSLVLVMMLKRVKDKLSTQEFWLPGSVCIIDNIGGLCLLALSRIQCWQTAQPGIPAPCGPTFCANGPSAIMDLVLYLVCETPVGTSASKASFQPPSQDKKKRQLRQFLGTIGVNLARTAFETDPFMEAMFASLNGVVLHVLAVHETESVRAMLQRLHRQREVLLGSRNGDKAFFRCLCRHLLQWLLQSTDELRDASIALWIDLLYFQKALLSEMLTVTLKVQNNAGYAINLVKNGFDMLLTLPKHEFLKWLELVGPPLKQLEANLDASYVLWVERTRKDVSKEWATYFAEKRKPIDDKAFLATKCKEQALELHDPCRREIQRQARSQADLKDRDLFGKRQFVKAAAVVAGSHDEAHRHTNLFVHASPSKKALPPTQWYLDRTEGTYRMRKRLLALPTPPPRHRVRTRRRAYSCSDLGRVLGVGLDVPRRPASPKQGRLPSSTSLVLDNGEYAGDDDDDDLGWHKWVLRDDSALDAKLRPLLLPGDDVSDDIHDCQRVDGMDKCPSVLLLGTQHVYLVDHLRTDGDSKRKVVATGGSHECRFWSYDDILELHKRRYLLQHVAIELFATDGRNYLIAFESGHQRERVFALICAKCPNVKGAASGLDRNATSSELLTKLLGNSLLERWVHGDVTNFEYLMHLNTLAGRSYNDLTQYPVFPWILCDYTSPTIDLSDPSVYRDLTKPMGALYREEEFRTRYESLEDGDVPAFHYGTHYSSSGIVLHYLMRLEPFTRGIQQLQGGRFDHADRLFASIPSAYASASGCSPSKHQSSNTQDVKELIPEFFYLPSFLENRNKIDFGRDQSGVHLSAVTLPPWAHGSAAEFVRVNRAALESPFVSSMLHHWIDLIFGFKQQGAAAVEACNVFYHLTYEGALDLETIADPALRAAYLDQINEFGQTPSQLFKMPHPPREKDKTLFRTRMQRTFLNRSVLGTTTPEQQPSPSDAPTLPTSLSWPLLSDVKPSLQPELKREGSYNTVVESFREPDANVVYTVGLRGARVVVVPSDCLLLPPPADALLSSDVKFLAWRCRDRSLRLFSMGDSTGDTRLLTALELPDFCASGAVATADGRTIITIDARAPILHVWFFKAKVHLTRTGATMQLQTTLTAPQHGRRITAAAVSRAYSILLSGCSSGHVLLWDLNRLVVVRKVLSAPTPIVAVAIQDVVGDVVVASAHAWYVGDVNGNVYASAETSVAISALGVSSHDAAAWSVETLLVTGHVDGTVRLWCYGLGPSVLKSICGASGPRVTSVVLSKDAKRVYAGHADGRVYLWRLEPDMQG